MESLSDKLKSLGVHLGVSQPLQPHSIIKPRIEQIVAGENFFTNFGEIFVVNDEIETSRTSGGLPSRSKLNILGEWANSTRLAQAHNEEIIFLDTETSGLAGGTGTFAFMIGLGYFTDHSFQLIQLFMRDPSEEPGLLSALHHFLGSFKVIVTYNGKSFDIPLLNSRHVLNGFTTPFTEIDHIDLLPLARRIWRNRLPSRALKDLETELLEVKRSQDEVPGWMIPEIYFNYLRMGDSIPLAGVFYHNGMDIISLASLFNYSAKLLDCPLSSPNIDSLDLIAIARLYDHLGRVDEAIEIYEKSLQQGLPLPFYLDTILRFSLIERKRGNWENAVQMWQKGAKQGSYRACVELAKYYEHQVKDIPQALFWSRESLEIISDSVSRVGDPSIEELKLRIFRLERKQERELRPEGELNG